MIINFDAMTKKIVKIYKNYGLDISSMTDDEINMLKKHYKNNLDQLKHDIKESERFAEEYSEKII